MLTENNILACKNWSKVFDGLKETGKRFFFKQGVDERLLTDEKCKVIFSAKYIGDYTFAFDNIKDKEIIESKLKLIRKYTNKVVKFYVFCGYNHDSPGIYTSDFWINDIKETFERIVILMKYKCLPYIMRYKDYKMSPYYGTYINLARWCNQPSLFKKKSYREFCQMNQNNTKQSKCSAIKYLEQIETAYPDIAKTYFDLKFDEVKSC